MIDRVPVFSPAPPSSGAGPSPVSERREVLRMVTNSRTAGSMPMWQAADNAKQEVEESLSLAQAGSSATDSSFKNMLAHYQTPIPVAKEDEFSFGDFVDMVNPLQHIPLVSTIYRKITGDEIKPAEKVIGGTLYGGPVGLAGGLVNLILEKETGKDVTGNALAFITHGEMPHLVNNDKAQLPGTVLSFADLSHSADAPVVRYAAPKRPVWERQ